MITKLIASLALLALAVVINIATMIFGWGLEPKSWTVIILIGFFGQMFIQVCSAWVTLDNGGGR